MKGLNIKKLAAIAIGGALIGSALAPVVSAAVTSNVDQLQKSDIVNSVTGSPVVNVVAGSGAAPSDFVWAGNIAAKVAQLASVEKTVAVTGGGDASTADPSGLTVDVTVGGTVSYSEASSQVYDNTNLTSSTAAPEFLAVLVIPLCFARLRTHNQIRELQLL